MDLFSLCQCFVVVYIFTNTYTSAVPLAKKEVESTEITRKPFKTLKLGKLPAPKLTLENLKLKKPLTASSIKEAIEKRLLLKKTFTSIGEAKTPTNYLENIIPKRKLPSPLKNRKAYEIDIPLKPIGLTHKAGQQIQSKRAILNYNVRHYSPLFKSIAMLFDDLFYSDPIESPEDRRPQSNTKTLSYSTKTHDVVCQCTAYPRNNSQSEEKAIAAAETSPFEIALPSNLKITNTSTNSASVGDLSNIRPHKVLPTLPPRNPTGIRRNNHGIFEGSGATRHGSLKRHLSRHHGNGEHNTEHQGNSTRQDYDEENTSSGTRNRTGGFRLNNRKGRLFRRIRSTTERVQPNNANRTEDFETENVFRGAGRQVSSLENEIEDEVRGVKMEDTGIATTVRTGRFISENKEFNTGKPVQPFTDNAFSIDGVRESIDVTTVRPEEYISENKKHDFRKPVQPFTDNKFGIDGVRESLADDKQIFDGNGTSSTENQRIQPKNKTGLELNGIPVRFMSVNMHNTDYNHVIITDSYSVATNKFGKLDPKIKHN